MEGNEREPGNAIKVHQHAGPGALCKSDRHDDRVLRLLHLRHGRCHRLSAAVLPGLRSRVCDPGIARDVRDRVHGAAGRLRGLRALWRSRRPQDHPRGRAPDDGIVDGGDRIAANLRNHRGGGAGAAGCLPFWPGSRPGRRMGRRRAAGDRERSAGQAGVVRDVSAARRPDRVLLFRRSLPPPVAVPQRRSVLFLRLAHSLSRKRRTRSCRTLRSPDDHGDTGLPGRRGAAARA